MTGSRELFRDAKFSFCVTPQHYLRTASGTPTPTSNTATATAAAAVVVIAAAAAAAATAATTAIFGADAA